MSLLLVVFLSFDSTRLGCYLDRRVAARVKPSAQPDLAQSLAVAADAAIEVPPQWWAFIRLASGGWFGGHVRETRWVALLLVDVGTKRLWGREKTMWTPSGTILTGGTPRVDSGNTHAEYGTLVRRRHRVGERRCDRPADQARLSLGTSCPCIAGLGCGHQRRRRGSSRVATHAHAEHALSVSFGFLFIASRDHQRPASPRAWPNRPRARAPTTI